MEKVRLNKYLSDAGVCSRREADRLTEQGKILVDGIPARMGMKVNEENEILVDGRKVVRQEHPVLLAVYKPEGIVCTTAQEEKDNIVDFLHYPARIYPVGRLDKTSEGLILMTNQGDLVNKILRGGNAHEKEYIVRINRPVTREFLQAMSQGVPILDTITRPCRTEKLDQYRFRIILTQGLNRQIRRMCEFLGVRVVSLKRVRVMNICLGQLKPGEYRQVQGDELTAFLEQLKDSLNAPGGRRGSLQAMVKQGNTAQQEPDKRNGRQPIPDKRSPGKRKPDGVRQAKYQATDSRWK